MQLSHDTNDTIKIPTHVVKHLTEKINNWVSADTQKRFDDISNGSVFLTSKHIAVGLHDVSDDFKPNCHTT